VAATAAALGVGLWAAFFWMESEQELRVLCDQVSEGDVVQDVRALFDTGLYLRSRLVLDERGDRWVFDSARNLGQVTCTVRLNGSDRVLEASYRADVDLPAIATRVALPLLGGMAFFQLVLAMGAPLGRLAWGGAHRRLPSRLRTASAGAVVVFACAAVAVLEARGLVRWVDRPDLAQTVLWILMLVFALSALANSASRRLAERLVGTPVAVLLCISCAVVALSFWQAIP
jgi:hypothetical protein